jgi:zinc transporter ZupT
MTPEATAATVDRVVPDRRSPLVWVFALVPIILLGSLLALLIQHGPAEMIQGGDAPPVEKLAITQVRLEPGRIDLAVMNDGPDDVTIAQVVVDDAFWAFEAAPSATVSHLQGTHISIPYPWVHGEAHVVRLLTSTGVTFDREILVALETPAPSARFFGIFALIGLYVGVIPVALGLLWYPLMRRIGAGGLQFLLALTVGLLAYLLVDSAHDGLEAAALVPGSYQGTALFVFGAIAAYVVLDMIGAWLARRRITQPAGAASGWVLAVLIAVGIGLHNFGEGLAIGSAFALGELSLGTLLIIGFTLHNTTEGLAIVAPLARERSAGAADKVGIGGLIQLGLIGGAPTIVGAWLGAFVYSPLLAVFFLSLGVGAIAQVTRQIVMQSVGTQGLDAYLRRAPVVAGLALGVVIMYATGLIVG